MNIKLSRVLVLLLAVTSITHAKPFIPQQDQDILERLPAQLFQSATNAEIKKLRTEVNNNPQDWSAARRLAEQYIHLAKRQADPRYMGYAQAILRPWWQHPNPPVQALLMRAMIRQNAHNFTAAIQDLDEVLALQPGHIQANFIKATIATVQGNYAAAIQHCQKLMRRSSIVLGLICQSTPASLSGNAQTSYRLLAQILLADSSIPDQEKAWAWTALAEIAWRLGDFSAAEQHFKSAFQIPIKDIYLQKIYADFLLQQQRPAEVIKLLATETQIDSLLLRLALAEKMTHSVHLTAHINLLDERFKANQKRGSRLHKGDEARFMLFLLNKPQAALQLALQNWRVQRESSDIYILLHCAIATKDKSTVQAVKHWLTERGTEDQLIEEILTKQTGEYYAS